MQRAKTCQVLDVGLGLGGCALERQLALSSLLRYTWLTITRCLTQQIPCHSSIRSYLIRPEKWEKLTIPQVGEMRSLELLSCSPSCHCPQLFHFCRTEVIREIYSLRMCILCCHYSIAKFLSGNIDALKELLRALPLIWVNVAKNEKDLMLMENNTWCSELDGGLCSDRRLSEISEECLPW